jgi:hypothetical protein
LTAAAGASADGGESTLELESIESTAFEIKKRSKGREAAIEGWSIIQ